MSSSSFLISNSISNSVVDDIKANAIEADGVKRGQCTVEKTSPPTNNGGMSSSFLLSSLCSILKNLFMILKLMTLTSKLLLHLMWHSSSLLNALLMGFQPRSSRLIILVCLLPLLPFSNPRKSVDEIKADGIYLEALPILHISQTDDFKPNEGGVNKIPANVFVPTDSRGMSSS